MAPMTWRVPAQGHHNHPCMREETPLPAQLTARAGSFWCCRNHSKTRDHRELSGHPQPVVVPLPQQSIELELLCFQQRHLLLCATPFCADLPLGNSFCGDSPSGFLAAAQCSPDSPACAPEHQWGLGSPPWYPSILTGLTWLLDRLWGKISQF